MVVETDQLRGDEDYDHPLESVALLRLEHLCEELEVLSNEVQLEVQVLEARLELVLLS